MTLRDEVREEIEALHRFFTNWFRGEIPRTAIGELDATLADGFVNVQPASRVLSREALRAQIVDGYGANTDFEITIHDVQIRWHSVDRSLVLATYIERQRGAKNTTPATNRRISTVLLQREGGAWIWLHVHETTIPHDE